MREIKFRAKGIETGKWYFGFVVIVDNRAFILNDIGGLSTEVDIKTVGQYTGLKDKNGKEIYEGDIFTFTAGKKRLTGQVIFEDAMFKMKRTDGWGAIILQSQGDMEVIGNIYENKELLK